jgi:hypothetical protein
MASTTQHVRVAEAIITSSKSRACCLIEMSRRFAAASSAPLVWYPCDQNVPNFMCLMLDVNGSPGAGPRRRAFKRSVNVPDALCGATHESRPRPHDFDASTAAMADGLATSC